MGSRVSEPAVGSRRSYGWGVGSLYFAFGSNMCRARLAERVGQVQVRGLARAPGWRHRFNKRGRDGTGKGNIEPADAQVWGVLYWLNADQLHVLDGFEGGYERRLIRVDGGTTVEAVSYVGLYPGPSLSPAPWYLEHYRAGIREHGLPAAWLAEIEAHARLGTLAHG